jgi:hypothetical protein
MEPAETDLRRIEIADSGVDVEQINIYLEQGQSSTASCQQRQTVLRLLIGRPVAQILCGLAEAGSSSDSPHHRAGRAGGGNQPATCAIHVGARLGAAQRREPPTQRAQPEPFNTTGW